MTTPRPHPRFAGADILIRHGVDMVREGTTEGNVGPIVGGVIVILLGVAIMVLGYYFRDVLVAWLGRVSAAIRGAGEGHFAPPSAASLELARLPSAGNESGSSPAASLPLDRPVDFIDIRVDADVEPAGPSNGWVMQRSRTYL